MDKWQVVTRAIVERIYVVSATNEKEAIAASCNAIPDAEDEIQEETLLLARLLDDGEHQPREDGE